jgi:hypothetical protein
MFEVKAKFFFAENVLLTPRSRKYQKQSFPSADTFRVTVASDDTAPIAVIVSDLTYSSHIRNTVFRLYNNKLFTPVLVFPEGKEHITTSDLLARPFSAFHCGYNADQSREDVLSTISKMFGSLLVIDGIIYRETPEPAICLEQHLSFGPLLNVSSRDKAEANTFSDYDLKNPRYFGVTEFDEAVAALNNVRCGKTKPWKINCSFDVRIPEALTYSYRQKKVDYLIESKRKAVADLARISELLEQSLSDQASLPPMEKVVIEIICREGDGEDILNALSDNVGAHGLYTLSNSIVPATYDEKKEAVDMTPPEVLSEYFK